MCRTSFLDLEYSLSGLGCEFPDEFQFSVSERNHFVILIDQAGNWTTSVRDPGHKRHNGLCSKTSRRQLMVELRFRIRNNVFSAQDAASSTEGRQRESGRIVGRRDALSCALKTLFRMRNLNSTINCLLDGFEHNQLCRLCPESRTDVVQFPS